MTDRFVSTLVIATSIIAAVRVASEEHLKPSPRLTSIINDRIAVAKMILEKIVG